MDITYDYYRIFTYVAKYGSFSRAAEVLLKGQPNITKTINNLEAQLGCKLFVRSNKGVTLTPEGEILFQHTQIAFETITKAEREIVSERCLEGGLISIAATEIGLYGSLLSALTKFKKDYPNVKIRLANFNSPQSLEAVRNGIADFAVVTLHEKEDTVFRATKICDFREFLCCKKGYAYDRDDLFASPYISINRNSDSYKFYQQFLLASNLYKEPDIEVATADQVLPLIKAGMGIGFVSEFLGNDLLRFGEIEEIALEASPQLRSIYFVEDKAKSLSPAARKLKEYLL